MSSVALFIIRIPEYASVTTETIGNWIEAASTRMNPTVYGAVYAEALVQYAAHLMKLAGLGSDGSFTGGAQNTGAVGAVKSLKSGGSAVTYGGLGAAAQRVSKEDAHLLQTQYGLQVLALRGSRAGVKAFVTGRP